MFNIWRLLKTPYAYYDYIWVDVLLVHETRKAVLIEFDNRKAWLPKAWIVAFTRSKAVKKSQPPEAISIKIALYYWAKKFS
jgi:hypothetical protein